MGPKLVSWKGKKNVFTIRLLPIGGYVNMVGEYGTEDEELSEEDRNKPPFNKKPIWQRLLVVLAGPAMNVFIGLLIMFCIVLNSKVIGSLTIADFVYKTDVGFSTSGNNVLYVDSSENTDDKGFYPLALMEPISKEEYEELCHYIYKNW